jgi:hypothetical protein
VTFPIFLFHLISSILYLFHVGYPVRQRESIRSYPLLCSTFIPPVTPSDNGRVLVLSSYILIPYPRWLPRPSTGELSSKFFIIFIPRRLPRPFNGRTTTSKFPFLFHVYPVQFIPNPAGYPVRESTRKSPLLYILCLIPPVTPSDNGRVFVVIFYVFPSVTPSINGRVARASSSYMYILFLYHVGYPVR